jgi:hypothetical protein
MILKDPSPSLYIKIQGLNVVTDRKTEQSSAEIYSGTGQRTAMLLLI